MPDNLTIFIYLLCVNIASILLFRFDKSMAQSDGRRVSEKNLLMLALVGGSVGALWARRTFRHKTNKQPFSTYLLLISISQAAIVIGLLVFGRYN